jgi:DNA-directed RNA polymerase specialized sigma24 family protein
MITQENTGAFWNARQIELFLNGKTPAIRNKAFRRILEKYHKVILHKLNRSRDPSILFEDNFQKVATYLFNYLKAARFRREYGLCLDFAITSINTLTFKHDHAAPVAKSVPINKFSNIGRSFHEDDKTDISKFSDEERYAFRAFKRNVDRNERILTVRKCILQLPKSLRYPIYLQVYKEMGLPEIARRLKSSRAVVNRRIVNAREIIKDRLILEFEFQFHQEDSIEAKILEIAKSGSLKSIRALVASHAVPGDSVRIGHAVQRLIATEKLIFTGNKVHPIYSVAS